MNWPFWWLSNWKSVIRLYIYPISEAPRTVSKPSYTSQWATGEQDSLITFPVTTINMLQLQVRFWNPSHEGTKWFHLYCINTDTVGIGIYTSRYSRSIRWLCTDEPAMWLPLPTPWYITMYRHTRMFSPPLSERTREGTLKTLTASSNNLKTVTEELFVEQWR